MYLVRQQSHFYIWIHCFTCVAHALSVHFIIGILGIFTLLFYIVRVYGVCTYPFASS